jgi:hypothetical protein
VSIADGSGDLDDHRHGARQATATLVPGRSVQLSSTGSNNILVQPGLSDAFGVAIGTIASTTAEDEDDHRDGSTRALSQVVVVAAADGRVRRSTRARSDALLYDCSRVAGARS